MSEADSTSAASAPEAFAPLVRTMLRGFRAADEVAMQALRSAGFKGSGPAAWYLLSSIPDEGGRASALARELGVTKQAVGQALRELEKEGYVTKEEDKADRRALRVRPTTAGREIAQAGARALLEQEEGWGAELGRTRMRALRATMEEFTELLVKNAP